MSWDNKQSANTAQWHTEARKRDEAYLAQGPTDDTETTDGPWAGAATSSLVPDRIRAVILAGHLGQVGLFCDGGCGTEEVGDYTGETREIRYEAARRHLAETKGWNIEPKYDGCPDCPPCVRCRAVRATGTCCSSHNKHLCHLCYRRTHFVEVCIAGCNDCATEGLPVNLTDLEN